MILPPGKFCEVYGDTAYNRVLETMLARQSLHFAIGDFVRDLGLSKPTIYAVFNEFLEKGYVIPDRKHGRLQLYILNKDHPHVKLLLQAFKACIQAVFDEYKVKNMAIVK